MIEINLDKNSSLYQIQKKLFENIISIRNDYQVKGISFNKIIISPSISNFIGDSAGGFMMKINIDFTEDEMMLIGYLLGMEVYVDLYNSNRKVIKMMMGKEEIRDTKINCILNNTIYTDHTVEIIVNSELI